MKKYVCISIHDKVEASGNDYNKGFRKCKSEELAQEIEEACIAYDEQGYDVLSILPIVQGQHIMVSNDGGWANSVTEGVIITFKEK
ncbi:hypothetical protein [Acetobacterium bakii]|uniref:Uncharacterized protein n=1 Tax=Acetobacterium bakii TaxID=52689 RepID=A0A0L6U157_9FIRM|nr:hypothetical protein [Acetobacterium bakii]KNZ42251.1 hypothetical protein AKG39_07675 [Acetobacterium bakii]